jgi:hypothetical protein
MNGDTVPCCCISMAWLKFVDPVLLLGPVLEW